MGRSSRREVLLAGAALASFGACRKRGGVLEQGGKAQVEVHDTLPSLIAALQTARSEIPEGPRAAWVAYEKRHGELLGSTGALSEDPGDRLLFKLAASPDAVLTLLEQFEERAPEEAATIVKTLEARLGVVPPAVLAFAVSREWRPVFYGRRGDVPVVLLNARHPSFTDAVERRTTMARELFSILHRTRVPESRSLGPLARRVFREGAASLAVRMLVPDATEEKILGLQPAQLARLRVRQTLVARELLAAFDSGREAEAARFFSMGVKDPLLPEGAGAFIADRLFQRLASTTASMERPLKLSPGEFVQRARVELQALATPPK